MQELFIIILRDRSSSIFRVVKTFHEIKEMHAMINYMIDSVNVSYGVY